MGEVAWSLKINKINKEQNQKQIFDANSCLILMIKKQGVCHIVALQFRLKRMVRQKKNYENSNISPCKNMIFKTIL